MCRGSPCCERSYDTAPHTHTPTADNQCSRRPCSWPAIEGKVSCIELLGVDATGQPVSLSVSHSLVVLDEGDALSGAVRERRLRTLVPRDVVDPVRLVVVARQHSAANQAARHLRLEGRPEPLVQVLPASRSTHC